MVRSSAVRFGMTAVSMAVLLATLAVVTSASHDEQDEAAAPAAPGLTPGPRRTDPVAMPTGLVGLEIDLGASATARSSYDGEVTVSEGKVHDLQVVRSGPNPSIKGNRFQVATAKKVANKKKKAAGVPRGPALYVTLDAPETATVTVKTGHGDFSFPIRSIDRARPTTFLDGEASVVRQEAVVRLTGAGTEDDFPALAHSADGTAWLAYVEYHPEQPRMLPQAKTKAKTQVPLDRLVPTRNGDVIRLRKLDGSIWQPAIDVTEGGLDVWRPTVAVDGKGRVWVAWAEQIQGDWEIRARAYQPGAGSEPGKWENPIRISNAKGSDFHVVAATDAKGIVWLAWQAFRNDNYEILATSLLDGAAAEPKLVSTSKGDDWGPSIAADRRGGVFVAWDSYDQGNFDVLIRDVAAGTLAIAVASSPRFEARPSIACDARDRVWVAYEEGEEQWGKDFASEENFRKSGFDRNKGSSLYGKRGVRIKCLVDGSRVMEPTDGTALVFPILGERNRSHPRLSFDSEGRLWLLFRHHPLPTGAGEVWVSSASHFDGQRWSPLTRLPSSTNLLDNRPALTAASGGMLVVFSSDHRQNTANRAEDDLLAVTLRTQARVGVDQVTLVASAAPAAAREVVHPNESADIARLRAYRVQVGGATLRPLRGEFHRHTEYTSHRDQDGSLEDSWRYGLDAASHDWMGNGDHDNGSGSEYLWWIIQKYTDLHHNPPRFVAAQTYERSVVYPNGHRNVMMPKRGIRPLPRGDMTGTEETGTNDTKALYAYLKHFGGICASHTSATNMGTDWRDNDPEVEPVVEIYQGHRHNYEYQGAPRSPSEATQIGGYEPKGFIWNALAKGYRLGFESSSDHVSTHLSYAIVYAEDTSRQAIIDAFKKRHCYAATDNILLDVRSGSAFMGDAFVAAGKPSLDITVKGTGPVAKVHVIRDNAYVFSTEPNQREVSLRYQDDDAKPGTHYYYVRVEQADGNLAWGSPLWITVGK